MSQQETGKTTAFIIPRYDRLSPGVSYWFNAFIGVCFLSFPNRILLSRRSVLETDNARTMKVPDARNIPHADPFKRHIHFSEEIP
jgi:hypothetical protein